MTYLPLEGLRVQTGQGPWRLSLTPQGQLVAIEVWVKLPDGGWGYRYLKDEAFFTALESLNSRGEIGAGCTCDLEYGGCVGPPCSPIYGQDDYRCCSG